MDEEQDFRTLSRAEEDVQENIESLMGRSWESLAPCDHRHRVPRRAGWQGQTIEGVDI